MCHNCGDVDDIIRVMVGGEIFKTHDDDNEDATKTTIVALMRIILRIRACLLGGNVEPCSVRQSQLDSQHI